MSSGSTDLTTISNGCLAGCHGSVVSARCSELYFTANGVGELGRGGGAAQIARPDRAGREHAQERRANPLRGRPLADVLEHQQPRQEQGGRVRQVLVRNVGSAAV